LKLETETWTLLCMRAVVQRVSRARVMVNGKVTGEIGPGLLVLLGVTHDDAEPAAQYLAEKIVGLQIGRAHV
jgi:D-tyrosyl-tRNA(Tyr) deacylase